MCCVLRLSIQWRKPLTNASQTRLAPGSAVVWAASPLHLQQVQQHHLITLGGAEVRLHAAWGDKGSCVTWLLISGTVKKDTTTNTMNSDTTYNSYFLTKMQEISLINNRNLSNNLRVYLPIYSIYQAFIPLKGRS